MNRLKTITQWCSPMIVALTLLLSTAMAETVTIKGDSELGERLVAALIDAYAQDGHVGDFETDFRDSGFAFKTLIGNRAQIGISTRKIRASETEAFRNLRLDAESRIVALDYMVVIAHEKNPVVGLTLRQLEAVFSGGTSDWSRVGGDRVPVQVFTPEANSERLAIFQEMALNGKNYASGATTLKNDSELARSVRFASGGLGFVGLSAAGSRGIKSLNVDGIAPEATNAASYPLSRRVYFYTVKQRTTAETKTFIEWATTSPAAAQAIGSVGLVRPAKTAAGISR